MTIQELIPIIKKLTYKEKIQLLQIIVDELAKEANIPEKNIDD